MTKVIHKTTLNETKKSKKARFSIINVITDILVITFIGLFICGIINSCYEDKNYMDNFYERKNSTLVRVKFEPENLLSLGNAGGYIDNTLLEKWQKGDTIKENITLYNPYSKEKSVTIATKTIKTIQVMSYRDFYENYDPKEYRWIFYKLLLFCKMYSKIGML